MGIFKQNDIRAIRSKSLLNEIETLYDEQHEQMEQTGNSYNYGVPHLTLNYRDKAVLDDASSLLIHHVKRQTSIHKENNDFKILWVVNSENYIYKKNALNIAKKTHPAVCRRKYKAMSSWHSSWAAQHVSEAAQSRHNDWMLGRVEGLRTNKTHRLTLSDLNKTPYR